MGARATVLLVAGFGLLLVAWAFADPPGASPDESAHYVKAVAAGRGDIRGAADTSATTLGATPAQEAWLRSVTRDFEVPGPLVPVDFGCEGFHPDTTAACHLAPAPAVPSPQRLPSYVGDYPPTLYVGPGVLMRVASDAASALQVGRLAAAALVLALLAAAAAMLAGGWRPAALAGLALAVTPTAVFLGSSLNPNGGEIAAAVCFAAGCLRLARAEPPGRGVWAATGLAGALLATGRTLGPLWVGLIALLPLLLLGFRGARARLRAGGAVAVGAVALAAAGVGLGLAWDVLTRGHVLASATGLGSRLATDLRMLPGVILPEQIGVFGFVDTELPRGVYWAWEGVMAGLLLAALAVATIRERVVLVAVSLLAVIVTLAVAVLLIDPTGFPMQGRYTLPLCVVVPLLAGEILSRHPERLRRLRGVGLPLVIVGVAALQAGAWWQNARRYAVGAHGPSWFVASAQWSPPGGWWTWIAVMLGGIAALAGAALLSVRLTRRPDVEEGGRDILDRPPGSPVS